MAKRASCKKINAYIKDEEMAIRDYHKLGYHGLEQDEREHKEFFEKLKKAKSCSTIGRNATMVSRKRSAAAKKAWRTRKRKYGKSGVKRNKRTVRRKRRK